MVVNDLILKILNPYPMLIRRFIPLVLGPVVCAGSFLLPGKARTAELVPPVRRSVDRAERAVVIPAVSRLLPATTAALLLLNPDPKLWQSLAQFKSFPRDMTTPGSLFSGAHELRDQLSQIRSVEEGTQLLENAIDRLANYPE